MQPHGGTVYALATAGIRQQKRIISYAGFACRQAAGNEANLNFQLLEGWLGIFGTSRELLPDWSFG